MKQETKILIGVGVAGIIGYIIWKNKKKSKSTVAPTDTTKRAVDSNIQADITPLPKGVPSKFSVSGGIAGSGSTYTFNANEGTFYQESNLNAMIQCIKAPCGTPPTQIDRALYIRVWEQEQKMKQSGVLRS